jgi:hypothetical protein
VIVGERAVLEMQDVHFFDSCLNASWFDVSDEK